MLWYGEILTENGGLLKLPLILLDLTAKEAVQTNRKGEQKKRKIASYSCYGGVVTEYEGLLKLSLEGQDSFIYITVK